MSIIDLLRRFAPDWLKRGIPLPFKLWVDRITQRSASSRFDFLRHPLVLPKGQTEKTLFAYLTSFQFEDGPSTEMDNYLRGDFRRFLYTLSLVPQGKGNLLEIGANPYFTSILIKKFTNYNLFCTNFFGSDYPAKSKQTKVNKHGERISFEFINYNVESDELPFAAGTFDLLLCGEIIEHLTNDPIKALINLKTLLKNGGYLILTTPNVARLENVAKMISGINIYDPYSGYGPYGRHNREYNRDELHKLLSQLGFEIEQMFTSDVNENQVGVTLSKEKMLDLVKHRKYDLGQYIFVRAKNAGPANPKKPTWLYRSYPADEMLNEC